MPSATFLGGDEGGARSGPFVKPCGGGDGGDAVAVAGLDTKGLKTRRFRPALGRPPRTKRGLVVGGSTASGISAASEVVVDAPVSPPPPPVRLDKGGDIPAPSPPRLNPAPAGPNRERCAPPLEPMATVLVLPPP